MTFILYKFNLFLQAALFIFVFQALANKGSPYDNETQSAIPENLLPHCNKPNCSGLLRPDIVWYGESLEPSVVEKAGKYSIQQQQTRSSV